MSQWEGGEKTVANRKKIQDFEEADAEVLFQRYAKTKDPVIRDRLVVMHQNLVRFLAGKFMNRGEPIEDLVQVGTIGLINAVDRYDLSRGTKFSTYATPTIVGEIRRHFRDKAWSLKVPRRLQELNLASNKAAEQLSQKLGRAPTIQEIAQAVEASEEETLEAIELGNAYDTVSIDSRVEHGDNAPLSLEEFLGKEDDDIATAQRYVDLFDAIECLDEREQAIIKLRFFRDMSQTEVAKKLSISQMHVSRLQQKALNRLKNIMSLDGGYGGDNTPLKKKDIKPTVVKVIAPIIENGKKDTPRIVGGGASPVLQLRTHRRDEMGTNHDTQKDTSQVPEAPGKEDVMVGNGSSDLLQLNGPETRVIAHIYDRLPATGHPDRVTVGVVAGNLKVDEVLLMNALSKAGKVGILCDHRGKRYSRGYVECFVFDDPNVGDVEIWDGIKASSGQIVDLGKHEVRDATPQFEAEGAVVESEVEPPVEDLTIAAGEGAPVDPVTEAQPVVEQEESSPADGVEAPSNDEIAKAGVEGAERAVIRSGFRNVRIYHSLLEGGMTTDEFSKPNFQKIEELTGFPKSSIQVDVCKMATFQGLLDRGERGQYKLAHVTVELVVNQPIELWPGFTAVNGQEIRLPDDIICKASDVQATVSAEVETAPEPAEDAGEPKPEESAAVVLPEENPVEADVFGEQPPVEVETSADVPLLEQVSSDDVVSGAGEDTGSELPESPALPASDTVEEAASEVALAPVLAEGSAREKESGDVPVSEAPDVIVTSPLDMAIHMLEERHEALSLEENERAAQLREAVEAAQRELRTIDQYYDALRKPIEEELQICYKAKRISEQVIGGIIPAGE